MRHRRGHFTDRCHHARADVVRRSGRAIRVRALEGAVRRGWNDETTDERDVSVTESGERVDENG